MSYFAGKTVIVTGSSNGIGQSAAIMFAKEGAKVTITGRNAERLKETYDEMVKVGARPEHINSIVCDITESEGQDRIIHTTVMKFGAINILVNNAGASIVDSQGRSGIDQGIDCFEKNHKLNLQSVIEMTKKAKQYLIESKGEIVNVSSVSSGPHAQDLLMYYGMAKAGLEYYNKSCAIDLCKYGIRVNAVTPGFVRTGVLEANGIPAAASEHFFNFMEQHSECVPCGKIASADDIAHLILFLADRTKSAYVIGQSLIADGGSSLLLAINTHDFAKILS